MYFHIRSKGPRWCFKESSSFKKRDFRKRAKRYTGVWNQQHFDICHSKNKYKQKQKGVFFSNRRQSVPFWQMELLDCQTVPAKAHYSRKSVCTTSLKTHKLTRLFTCFYRNCLYLWKQHRIIGTTVSFGPPVFLLTLCKHRCRTSDNFGA